MNQDALLAGELNAAVDHLIKCVSSKVLSKTMLDSSDTIAVNGSMELSCDIFERFRQHQWLDSWTIIAAMEISDKPEFVRYDLSIPLDENRNTGQMKPITRPLAGWTKKIANHRRLAKGTSGLVYFCPINHRNSHFTLLEINEREQTIRHYDSKADPETILGDRKTRISKLVMEEFGGLKFSYYEAVSVWLLSLQVID